MGLLVTSVQSLFLCGRPNNSNILIYTLGQLDLF